MKSKIKNKTLWIASSNGHVTPTNSYSIKELNKGFDYWGDAEFCEIHETEVEAIDALIEYSMNEIDAAKSVIEKLNDRKEIIKELK